MRDFFSRLTQYAGYYENYCASNIHTCRAFIAFFFVYIIGNVVSTSDAQRLLFIEDTLPRQRTWGEIFTDEEQAKLRDYVDRGWLHEENIDAFLRRFSAAPERQSAFDQAFDTSFGANVRRELHSWKKGVADPTRGVEAAEQFFKKQQEKYGKYGGVATSISKIGWRTVTTPFRSLYSILSGNVAESENPLETIFGTTPLTIMVMQL